MKQIILNPLLKFLFLTLYLLVSSTGYVEALETKETKGILYDLESGEPFTGEITFQDDNNFYVYLIYGHDFSHRVMSYVDGKLDGVSSYVDQGGNPVGFEYYEDGVVKDQWSGAHEAFDRGRNYGPECGSAGSDGWRRCPTIKSMGKE